MSVNTALEFITFKVLLCFTPAKCSKFEKMKKPRN